MKKYYLLFTVAFFQFFAIYSQDDYMADIVTKACECVSEIAEAEDMSNVNIGLCIINESAKYKEELLRDHNINMANIDDGTVGEELGRIVALEMFTTCPEQMKRIATISTQNNDEENEEYESVEGIVNSIVKSDFIIFSITSNDNKTSKFYWLTFIESDNNLQNEFENLKERKVRVEYSLIELYDPKLGEYRNYNVIESLNILN